MREVGRNPASIIPVWQQFVDESEGRPVRGIGEPVWAGMGPTEIADFVTATSELAANSVRHGGDNGILRLWREEERLLAEVKDRGLIDEPLAGRTRPEAWRSPARGS